MDLGVNSYDRCLDAPVADKHISENLITVLQPDWDTMVLTHKGDLDPPQLPQAAQQCHTLPAIKHFLIPVVNLYKAGCKVKFIKWSVGIEISYRGRMVLKGSLNKRTGLWIVPLTHSKP